MLKMIIADDECIIRETIQSIIDWKKYDIEVIGLCKNGIETYNMILDENPDIVLTDIKMPGMDGIELIKRIAKMDLNVQFIILSGYGEFSYAQEAMKSGVRHYLLKPCSEDQVIECIQQCKKYCYQQKINRHMTEENFAAISSMNHNIIFSIINDWVYQKLNLEQIRQTYESYMDFEFTAYRLYYVYYLIFEDLGPFLRAFEGFCRANLPGVTIHGVYVKNNLLLFFKSYSLDYQELEQFLKQGCPFSQSLKVQSAFFSNLEELLSVLLRKIARFSVIYYINGFHLMYTCNYSSTLQELEQLYQILPREAGRAAELLSDFFDRIHDLSFLKQVSCNLILKLSLNNPNLSSADITDLLLEIEGQSDPAALKSAVIQKVPEFLTTSSAKPLPNSAMTQMIFDYVNHNLQNPDLTLKYIADNCLYMNADYVSKKFFKETGTKFSAYLTDIRIRRAKELLRSNEPFRIQDIAEKLGFGNNPEYFSKVFKQKTGMTPRAYFLKAHGS